MIKIEWDRYTAECQDVQDAKKRVKSLGINMQDATITLTRIRIPGIAFDPIVQDIIGSGGKIL
jgi:hypothetical protein